MATRRASCSETVQSRRSGRVRARQIVAATQHATPATRKDQESETTETA